MISVYISELYRHEEFCTNGFVFCIGSVSNIQVDLHFSSFGKLCTDSLIFYRFEEFCSGSEIFKYAVGILYRFAGRQIVFCKGELEFCISAGIMHRLGDYCTFMRSFVQVVLNFVQV